jgi:O-antigen/teichoic acid export membrane protein
LIRSILSNWSGMVLLAVLSFLTTPFLLRHLGDRDYGLWILTASLLEYYGLLDFGLRTTLQRFVARARGSDARGVRDELFSTALGIALGVTVVITLGTGLLAIVVPGRVGLTGVDPRRFAWLLALLGLGIAFTYPARIISAYLTGLQRFDLSNTLNVGTSALRSLLLVVVLKSGLGLLGCAAVTLAVAAASLLMHGRAVRRADPQVTVDWSHFRTGRVRDLATYSFFVFLGTVGFYLRFFTDSIVITWSLGVSLIAHFSVAAKLMEYFMAVLYAVTQPLMSRMSELDSMARPAELQALFLRSTRFTSLLTFLIGSLLLLKGEGLLTLWAGPRFSGSVTILYVLLSGFVVALAQSPSLVVLQARGHVRTVGLIGLGEGLLNLTLSLALARPLGLLGVALGTAIPLLLTKLFVQPHLTLTALQLDLGTYWRDGLKRPLLALMLFLPIAYFLPGRGADHALLFIIGGLVHVLLFAVLSYAVGMPTEDRRWVRSAFERAWTRFPWA